MYDYSSISVAPMLGLDLETADVPRAVAFECSHKLEVSIVDQAFWRPGECENAPDEFSRLHILVRRDCALFHSEPATDLVFDVSAVCREPEIVNSVEPRNDVAELVNDRL